MITVVNTCNVNTGHNYNAYMGKSTDIKPTENELNGSIFYEMDTGDVYLFDAETSTWLKQ